ncbi:COMM domain-containing protein 3 isoform X3 [Paroedura picta]|uniref:COMM domain-containing protein 3 isoform X3 n=1 Tax=Paroedura picta TaxID=143630 RepID=UPI0040560984
MKPFARRGRGRALRGGGVSLSPRPDLKPRRPKMEHKPRRPAAPAAAGRQEGRRGGATAWPCRAAQKGSSARLPWPAGLPFPPPLLLGGCCGAAGSAERAAGHVGGVSKVAAGLTMELSEPVQSGLRRLADPGCFSPRAFAGLLQAAFRSLLAGRDEQAALDHPDLEHIDPAVLKYCHAAAATCIVEAGKHKAERAAISTCLEDCKFDRERIEQFCTEYQKNKDSLEILLGSVGRCPLHITDVSWRLEYQIKDLVGKLKDAAKSLERTTQL